MCHPQSACIDGPLLHHGMLVWVVSTGAACVSAARVAIVVGRMG
jgi:hypothetical protein